MIFAEVVSLDGINTIVNTLSQNPFHLFLSVSGVILIFLVIRIEPIITKVSEAFIKFNESRLNLLRERQKNERDLEQLKLDHEHKIHEQTMKFQQEERDKKFLRDEKLTDLVKEQVIYGHRITEMVEKIEASLCQTLRDSQETIKRNTLIIDKLTEDKTEYEKTCIRHKKEMADLVTALNISPEDKTLLLKEVNTKTN